MGESFPMNGGDGALSYAKNSQYQKQASDSAKGMMQEAVIHSLDAEKLLSFSTTVRIADLGCSVGPNTFFTVQDLIESVENKLSSSSKNIEFQVFFNDHSTNDFNTLFASLPPERQYYAAGVPGSFHGRLFPSNSISIAYSSYALHWLSKQPQGPLNEGRIHYIGAPEDVLRAYSDQFSRDLGSFMSARAEEIVSGGLVFLIMPGNPEEMSDSGFPGGFLFDFLGNSLMDLAHEGVVEKTKIDEFNLPMYAPTAAEMRKVIEENGYFSIERLELRNPRSNDEGALDVASLIAHLRAGTEGAFAPHFGSSVVEKMFSKVTERAQEISQLLESSSGSHNRPNQLFLMFGIPDSIANLVQKLASDSVKEMIQNAVIENLDAENLFSFPAIATIADLGCSVGPNTFFTVQNLIESVKNKHRLSSSSETLEFQVFFNDHSANDFNTLFASLPPEKQYHAAGVPGSFYGRLFPTNSITVAHSSYALQWLSKKPPQLGVSNEGRIHYSNASENVVRAYSDQFEADFGAFMSARAAEIVRGGIMILILPGNPDGVSYSDLPVGVTINFLGSSLMDLANEGIVEKSAVDAFNLPLYFPTGGEMRKAVEKNARFSIERMEFTNPYEQYKRENDLASMMLQIRASVEGIVDAHFGDSVVEKLFANVLAKGEEILPLIKAGFEHSTQLFVVLKRT